MLDLHNSTWTVSHLIDHLGDVATGAGSLYILSSAARSLPEPLPFGSRFYLWFYNFSQAMVANWDRISGAGKKAEAKP